MESSRSLAHMRDVAGMGTKRASAAASGRGDRERKLTDAAAQGKADRKRKSRDCNTDRSAAKDSDNMDDGTSKIGEVFRGRQRLSAGADEERIGAAAQGKGRRKRKLTDKLTANNNLDDGALAILKNDDHDDATEDKPLWNNGTMSLSDSRSDVAPSLPWVNCTSGLTSR